MRWWYCGQGVFLGTFCTSGAAKCQLSASNGSEFSRYLLYYNTPHLNECFFFVFFYKFYWNSSCYHHNFLIFFTFFHKKIWFLLIVWNILYCVFAISNACLNLDSLGCHVSISDENWLQLSLLQTVNSLSLLCEWFLAVVNVDY